jgi:alanyl aminopeptidase
LNAHAHGSALADDFFDALSEGARDVEPGIRSFLDQRGIPIVEARLDCGASAIRLSQRPYVPPGGAADDRTWQIPVCVRLGLANALEVQCTTLASREATLALARPECPAWIHPNANGASYYLWSMPGAESQALVQRGLDRATTGERLSLVMSLVLGFDARAPNARAVLEIFVDQSRREPYFVAELAAGFLARLHTRIVAPEDRDGFRRFVVGHYGRDAIRLGWSHEDGSLRGPALELLVETLRDPRAVEDAARRARRWAGLDGPAERNAVHWRYTDIVLAAGVRTHGAEMFDALEARLPVATAAQRAAILHALGSAADRDLVARALTLASSDALDGREAVLLLQSVFDGEAHDLALEHLERHFDDLAARISRRGIDATFALPDGLCTEEDARRVEQVIAPRAPRGENGPRTLAYTLDAIRSCAARVEAERTALHHLLAP